MTYNPAIPQSTDLISNSQSQLLDNFSQLNTQFAIDHVAFNTGSGNGDGHHKKVTFDNAPSTPAAAGTVSVIYPALVGSTQCMMFKNATQTIQMTGPYVFGAGNTTGGYVTLQGGLILQWGTLSLSTSQAYTFSTQGIAFASYCFTVQITVNASVAASCAATNITKDGFTFLTSSSPVQVTYFAIGI